MRGNDSTEAAPGSSQPSRFSFFNSFSGKRGALACVTLAIGLLLPAAASAAIPAHLREEARDVTGLNHACGIATDTEGDLYASSAATSEVKVYDPSHNELTSIPDVHEPCALALTTTGALYVSEKATGEVVRFKPTVYPLSETPSYGPREVIDSSGQAKGISVDPFDNRLYVAEGDHVTAYDSAGKLGADEVQEINCFLCKGGSYKLIFKGEETASIPFEGPASEVEAKLLALTAFEPGDVSVVNEGTERRHVVTFAGKYAHEDVEAFGANPSITGEGSQILEVAERVKGFNGRIGEGDLTEATGVAPYTYKTSSEKLTYHLAVADASEDQVKLFSAKSFTEQKLRRTLNGPAAGEEFGFAPQGAYLAADKGSCPPAAQACAAGHFLLYDHSHEVIDEFEANGELVSQTPFAFPGAEPTALAVERSAAGNGTLYATSGSGAGAKAIAFNPLPAPSRTGPEAPPLSLTQPSACSVAIDSHGDRYVAVGTEVFVYPPSGSVPLAKIEESSGLLCRIAVDSEGNVYALLKEKVAYFKPTSFPPEEGTTYGAAVTVAKQSELGAAINALTIDPANDHLLANAAEKTIEYDSAKEGSGPIGEIAAGFSLGVREAVATCAKSGNVYIAGGGSVFVLNEAGTEALTQISGVGSPKGSFGAHVRGLAVDQSDCHLLAFETSFKALEEYEASGAYVGSYGAFSEKVTTDYGVAVDNGQFSPNKGTAYLAYDDPAPETYDLTAFGPLSYGEAPLAITGTASGIGGGEATLNATVDPRGFEVEECAFQYTTQESYEAEAFASAAEAACEPDAAELGEGSGAVAVKAEIGGLDPEGRYRFRVVATNKYGTRDGDPGLFGPPLAQTEPAHPVLYTEATLRAAVDPSGLPTTYRFEYGTSEAYGHSTAPQALAAGDGPLALEALLEGLAEGAAYHFRILAENEAGASYGSDLTLHTFARPGGGQCPNAAYRVGPSAALPDCRAYELVTPPETNGYAPFWGSSEPLKGGFVTALAAAGGESLVFETEGPLPDTEGNGVRNGYRAERTPSGWQSVLYGPTYPQTSFPAAGGVSADQGYSFWAAGAETGSLDPEEGVANARYLALPEAGANPACGPEPGGRFELIGCGSEGTDPEAIGRFISPGAGHVIFLSAAHLEPGAPAKGATAIYDRSPGGATHVVSLLPGDVTPSGGATYDGVSADGSAVAFGLGGTLYVRRDGETLAVVAEPAEFAGLARDGSALFYVKGGALHRFDAKAATSTQIASGGAAAFVNVAADGSRAYFTSTEDLAPGAAAGEHNLYLWEAAGDATRFVATLDNADLEGIANLAKWVEGLDSGANGVNSGPAIDPSRTTPDGQALLFQSHAPLTGYDSAGHSEVFRYGAGEGLACLSCGLEGTSAGSDALLQDEGIGSPTTSGLAPIANLSTDGQTAFFNTAEPLVPADVNGLTDVYEWRAGQVSLISTGQSDRSSFLYAASASGEDVFFYTLEQLLGRDVPGSASLYDARVNGGFPEAGAEQPCQGDACQGSGTPALAAPNLASAGPAEGNLPAAKPSSRCPKGKHKVRRKGKTRCVAKHHRKHRHGRKHHHAPRALQAEGEPMKSRQAILCAFALAALAALPAPAGAAEAPCELTPRYSCFGLETVEASLSTHQAGAHPDLTLDATVAQDPASKAQRLRPARLLRPDQGPALRNPAGAARRPQRARPHPAVHRAGPAQLGRRRRRRLPQRLPGRRLRHLRLPAHPGLPRAPLHDGPPRRRHRRPPRHRRRHLPDPDRPAGALR